MDRQLCLAFLCFFSVFFLVLVHIIWNKSTNCAQQRIFFFHDVFSLSNNCPCLWGKYLGSLLWLFTCRIGLISEETLENNHALDFLLFVMKKRMKRMLSWERAEYFFWIVVIGSRYRFTHTQNNKTWGSVSPRVRYHFDHQHECVTKSRHFYTSYNMYLYQQYLFEFTYISLPALLCSNLSRAFGQTFQC